MRPRAPKALNPETESQRLEFANDLKDNDDFLASILVDAFGTEEDTFMGVHYQSADFESRRPDIDRQDVFRIVKETVVENDMTQGIIEMMRLPAFEKYCEEKLNSDKTRIKTFQEHLKRYLSLYSPKCRVEIKMTDRYSWHTGHAELGIVATRDLLPLSGTSSFGHRLRWGKVLADDNEPWDKNERKFKRARRVNTDPILTELTGGLAQLPYSMRKDIDDLDEHEFNNEPEVVIDLDAPLEPMESPFEDESISETNGVEPQAVEIPDEEVKMRDFSIVQSSRYGTMLFLGPGRFLNHDCEPNVKLAASGTRSKNMTFKVIKPIRTGEEIYTYYGPNYFGPGNRECLCFTCEKNGRGVFTRGTEEDTETGAEVSDMMQTATLSTARNDSDSVMSPRRCSGKDGLPNSPTLRARPGPSSRMTTPRKASVPSGSDSEADGCGLLPVKSSKSAARLKQVTRRPDSMLLRLDASDLTEEERVHLRKMKGKGKAILTPIKVVQPKTLLRDGSITPAKSMATWVEEGVNNTPTRDRVRRQAGLAAESTLHTMIHDPWRKGKRFSKRVNLLGQVDRDDNESRATSSVAGGDDDPEVWNAPRCTTCLLQCDTLIQVGEFSITLCERCTRHHRIFGYPWPARSRAEVFKYPPRHVRPGWWRPNRADQLLRNEYMAGIDQEERALKDIIGDRPKRRQQTPKLELPLETPEEREGRLAQVAIERAEELIAAKRRFETELILAREILAGILNEAEVKIKEDSSKKTYMKGSSVWRRYEYVEITEEPEPDLSEYAGKTRRGRAFGRDSASASVTPSIAVPRSSKVPATAPVKTMKPAMSVATIVTDSRAVSPLRRGRHRKHMPKLAEAAAESTEDHSSAMDAAMELLNDIEAGEEGSISSRRVGSSPSELERDKLQSFIISPVRSGTFRDGTASSVRTAEAIAVDDATSLDTGSGIEPSETRPISAGQSSDHTRQQITAALQENGLFPTSKEREGGDRPRVMLDRISDELKTDKHPKRKLDGRSTGPSTPRNGTTISTSKRPRIEVSDRDLSIHGATSSSAASSKHVPPKLDLWKRRDCVHGLQATQSPQDVIVLTDSPDEETFSATAPAKRHSRPAGISSISPRGPNFHSRGRSMLRTGTTIETAIMIPDDPSPPAHQETFADRRVPSMKAGASATAAQRSSAVRGSGNRPVHRRRVEPQDFRWQPEQPPSTDTPSVDAQAAMRNSRAPGGSRSEVVVGGESKSPNAWFGGRRDSNTAGSTNRQSTPIVPASKAATSSRHAVEHKPPRTRQSGWQDNANTKLSDSVIQTPTKRRRAVADEDRDEERASQLPSADKSTMFSATWAALRGAGLANATFPPATVATSSVHKMTPSSVSQAGRVAWDDLTRIWGTDPRTALGPNLQPVTYDTALLLALSALRGHFPSPGKWPVLLQILERTINRRLNVQGSSTAPRRLTVEDLESVLKNCRCIACRGPRNNMPASASTERRLPPSALLLNRGVELGSGVSPAFTDRLPTASLRATPLGKKKPTSPLASSANQFQQSSGNHITQSPYLEQSPPPHMQLSSSPMALGLLGARNVFQRHRPWARLSGGSDEGAGAVPPELST